MGENYLRQQVSNFKKRYDLACIDDAIPELFTRPEIVERKFTAIPETGESLEIAEKLYAVVDEDGHSVAVLRGTRVVAHICGEDSRAMREALSEPESSGVVLIGVVDVATISGVGTAVVERPET